MQDKHLVFRRATLADTNLLAVFGAHAFKEAFGAQNKPDDMAAYLAEHFSPTQIQNEIEDPRSIFLLAYLDSRLAGYARLFASEPPAAVQGDRPIELVRIYVDPEFIGRGYGSALMQTCLDTARSEGFRTIWLGVWQHNQRALDFYFRWGFRTAGVKPFVLGDDVQQDLILEFSL
ncbi:MAG: GNAT family N-acetyltransferase [Anaerolineales bacterium]